jgi:hypothetical protein
VFYDPEEGCGGGVVARKRELFIYFSTIYAKSARGIVAIWRVISAAANLLFSVGSS